MTTARVPVERGSPEVIERIIRGGSRTGRRESPSPPAQRVFSTTRQRTDTRTRGNERRRSVRGGTPTGHRRASERYPRASELASTLARGCQRGDDDVGSVFTGVSAATPDGYDDAEQLTLSCGVHIRCRRV